MIAFRRTVGILKDVVLCRVKAYNAPALASFLLTDFEKFFVQKMIDVATGRLGLKTDWLRYKPVDIEQFIQVDDNLFEIKVRKNAYFYVVDLENFLCTCPFGKVGRCCKHIVIFKIF